MKDLQIFEWVGLCIAHKKIPQPSELIQLEHFLYPEELHLSERISHPVRKAEFLCGRYLLHSLDSKLPPVLAAPSGMPVWPSGYVGSISHKHGQVVAILGLSSAYSSLAIDLEAVEGFPSHISSWISSEEEFKSLEGQVDSALIRPLIFSAKESLFKLCYPLTQQWFGFHDAQVLSISPKEGRMHIQLLRELPPVFAKGQVFEAAFQVLAWTAKSYVLTLLTCEA